MLVKRRKPVQISEAIKEVVKILMAEGTEKSIAMRYAKDDLHRIARSKKTATQCLAGSTAYAVFRIANTLKVLKGFYEEAVDDPQGKRAVPKPEPPPEPRRSPMLVKRVGRRFRR